MIYEISKILIVQILAILYSKFEGEREAYYYLSASKTGDSNKYNIHSVFYTQRALFIVACAFITGLHWYTLFNVLGIIFCFPFIHDGFYYHYRHKLTQTLYPEGFASDSTTSTARQEFNYETRAVLFAIGVFLFSDAIIFCVVNYI